MDWRTYTFHKKFFCPVSSTFKVSIIKSLIESRITLPHYCCRYETPFSSNPRVPTWAGRASLGRFNYPLIKNVLFIFFDWRESFLVFFHFLSHISINQCIFLSNNIMIYLWMDPLIDLPNIINLLINLFYLSIFWSTNYKMINLSKYHSIHLYATDNWNRYFCKCS